MAIEIAAFQNAAEVAAGAMPGSDAAAAAAAAEASSVIFILKQVWNNTVDTTDC